VNPSPQELADQYTERLRAARDPWREGQRLIAELNSLPYLTRADRLHVVDLVRAQVMGPVRRPGEMEYIFPTPWSGDNARTLDLIRAIRGMIK